MHRFLHTGRLTNLRPAGKLGGQAANLGLETLDIAGFHKQALEALPASTGSPTATRRATQFFDEAIAPIEATHRAALQTNRRIRQLTRTLRGLDGRLSSTTARLERSTARRRAAEAALEHEKAQHGRQLSDAKALQTQLRTQTRRILSAHEDGRKDLSGELRNEIAQALLAIDVSLLTLKASASARTKEVEKEIAKAQCMIGELSKRGSV